MAKQNSSNQNNGQSTSNASSTADNKQTVESAPTADQPTPVSASTQQFGTQAGKSQQGQSSQAELKEAGREVADEAKRAVDHATHEVKNQADELRREAQGQATNLLNEQKDVAAQRVGGVAEALRQAGQGLADRDEEMLAHYTDSLAGQLDNFSNTLRDREIGSLVEDAKQLAHRQPELFVAGALAAGFVLGRFFKSSSQSGSSQAAYESYDPRGPRSSGARSNSARRDGEQSNGSYRQYADRPFETGGYQETNSQWTQPSHQSGEHVTTHGLGTGQSIQHQEDLRKGQEFGQGYEQVSSDEGIENSPAAGISTATTKSNTRTDRQEGERK